MAIEFHCSNKDCRKTLEVADELAGKKARCPKCKTVMVVPRPDSGTDADDSTGYEATMALEEKLVEEEQPEEDGVEALDAVLDKKRGQIEPFEAQEEIARGGMGAVLLAKDKAIQRELAVKVMRPQIADSEEHRLRFLEEAQVTGQLEHPNIVPIHELGKDAEGNLYFTMKLVKGRSLGQIIEEMKEGRGSALQSREPLEGAEKNSALETGQAELGIGEPAVRTQATYSLPDLLNIFLKVCDGIAFAHSKGVIHRDLKPDNIMVGEFGEVQIMDWGLAKVRGQESEVRSQGADEQDPGRAGSQPASGEEHEVPGIDAPPKGSPGGRKPEAAIRDVETEPAGSQRAQDKVRSVRTDSDVALTMDGQVTGTPAYMPPEQAEGNLEKIDHRSDVYSLGAILYEILTLERPIEGDTVHKVLLNVADGRITPLERRAPRRNVPKELSAITLKAMAKRRRARYQSVQDLGQDIKLFLEGRSVSAKEDTFVETVTKLVKRNKGISVAVGVASAVLAFVLIAAFLRVTAEKNEAVRQKKIAETERQEAQQARNEMHENAMRSSKALAEQAVRAAEAARWTEAELRVEAAVQISPADGPWGAYAEGMLHKERKEFEKAEESFKKALAVDAKHAPSIAALAEVQASLGKLKDAVALIQTVDETTDWRTLMAAGEALYAAEDYRQALAAFEKTREQMGTAKDVPPQARERVEEMLGRASAWVKCEGFWESIRDLPPEEQAERVRSRFEDIHGRPIQFNCTIKEGVLAEMLVGALRLQPLRWLPLRKLSLGGEALRDLDPLKGLPLRELVVYAGGVSDLSPLKGMPLSRLDLRQSQHVSDLRPLTGLKLTFLDLGMTSVSDLSPLRGMPLARLDLHGTKVSDVAPLHGMPLESLSLAVTPVRDLSPLKGVPVESLSLHACYEIESLAPLRGCPIRTLDLSSTKIENLRPLEGMSVTSLSLRGNYTVRDLTPLKGMPLISLNLDGARGVADIGPLRGMPLRKLDVRDTAVRDLAPLHGMPLISLICYNTGVSDLAPLAGMPLALLQCYDTYVTDLGPLKGMPLVELQCTRTRVSDLSPLRGMPLAVLGCATTRVSDLSPLEGMQLAKLWCYETGVSDLSPIKGMPLTLLGCEETPITDLTPLEGMKLEWLTFTPKRIAKGIEVIRQMKSIVKIGTHTKPMKPGEFWKKYDAGEFK